MIFHFLVTVWGDEFVDLFLNLCLPNQLTPGNLLAFRSDGLKATYIIYTTARDQETIERHENYRRLSAVMPVEIHTVDFLFASTDGVESVSLMTRVHQIAIPRSNKQQAYLVFLPPDQVYSEGALGRLIALARAGKRVVLVSGVRLLRETFRPAFEAAFTDGDGRMPAPARPLVGLALQHLHPMAQSYRVESSFSNDDTNQLYWAVGDEGFVSSSLVSHPLMIRPRDLHVVPLRSFDGDYPLSACPNFGDYHLVTDSDEMMAFELSAPAKRIGVPGDVRRFNLFRYAIHARHGYNRIHRKIAQGMVRIHTRDCGEEWDAVEARARKTAFAMRLLVVSADRHVRYSRLYEDRPNVVDVNTVARVAIFGAGAGGTRAKRLADRCGWTVTRWVDNDAALWGSQREGLTVTDPQTLETRDFDVVIVASMPGRLGIFTQLSVMGFYRGKDFVYFYDSFSIDGFRLSLEG